MSKISHDFNEPRQMVLLSAWPDKDQAIVWCEENIGERGLIWDCYSNYAERAFFFNNKKDAILFSLRWL